MKYIKKVSASYQGDTPIATSITSSSTNDEVAGAKAVYDFSQAEDITNQVTFTLESGITEMSRTVYKRGNIITLILGCQYSSRSAGLFSLGTLSLTPIYQSYGVGTSFEYNVGTFGAYGRINTSGVVTAITTGTSYQVTFNIDFPLATQTRSINLTKSSTEETKTIEQPLEKEETKETEKTTLQNEGSGDSK